jgi:hypothetical protein
MSFCRKYVQLLFVFGFGGGKDCPIHEQSGLCLTDALTFEKVEERAQNGAVGSLGWYEAAVADSEEGGW